MLRGLLLRVVCVGLTGSVLLAAHAQSNTPVKNPVMGADGQPLTFDVVTVKVSKAEPYSWGTDTDADHVLASNMTLRQLIEFAYDVKKELISGVSGPMELLRFDVEAKVLPVDPDAKIHVSDEQLQEMMAPVIAERFHLKMHEEMKQLQVYESVVAKGGPKLTVSKHAANDGHLNISNNRELAGTGVPMDIFTGMLADQVHRTVIDKTGLTALYDFTLKWTPDGAMDAGVDAGPSIYTAVQEQLGLKLQSAKGSVKTLVVDHVEMPSEN